MLELFNYLSTWIQLFHTVWFIMYKYNRKIINIQYDNIEKYIKYYNDEKYKDNSNDNKFTKKTNTKQIKIKKSNYK